MQPQPQQQLILRVQALQDETQKIVHELAETHPEILREGATDADVC
jgi:hypothetical protein